MDNSQVYWQVAKGDGSRDASPVFLKYGIAAIGPGDWGPYYENADAYHKGKEWYVRQIAEEVIPGHRIILRSGTRKIIATGIVRDTGLPHTLFDENIRKAYLYHDAFGDLDGMDWQHIVRVTWKSVVHEFSSDICGPRPSRLSKVTNMEVKTFVEQNLPEGDYELPLLPPDPKPMEIVDVATELFNSGLANSSVDLTVNAIERIRRQLSWYRQAGYPKEHETVSHMVVPLLLGLGWSEQQLAVEWNNIDIAAFGTASNPKNVRIPANCRMIVEVKRVGEGLWWAGLQAQQYLEKYNLANCCGRVVVTDGVRYNVLDSKSQTGYYINLDHDKLFRNTIDGKKSTDALRWMQPNTPA